MCLAPVLRYVLEIPARGAEITNDCFLKVCTADNDPSSKETSTLQRREVGAEKWTCCEGLTVLLPAVASRASTVIC